MVKPLKTSIFHMISQLVIEMNQRRTEAPTPATPDLQSLAALDAAALPGRSRVEPAGNSGITIPGFSKNRSKTQRKPCLKVTKY